MKHGVGHKIHTKEKTICRKQERFFFVNYTNNLYVNLSQG